ncbi:hypothetical protein M427DRAFT_154107 [Gonapodya prolifera JEL478]|uniref:EGF-like domain-containing protein n=1 Tax=Gonapodya prolifera (strain JEL478) TaxID=1344416 RepID=A0A139AJJ2_GONPJ|nr:hypothetical protein M427DRAFT_154107 [Gonapodya prolifera JEL478]|eukprot:KXS16976.1 hypothetical protein M427DRAFT_154107 [Gonapodya prolifera JEL478]
MPPPAYPTHPRPYATASHRFSAWPLILFLLAVAVAVWTRPGEDSFHKFAKTQVADRESYLSRNLNLTPRMVNGAAVRFTDRYLLTTATFQRYPDASFLGFFGSWYPNPITRWRPPASLDDLKGLVALPRCLGGCGDGICVAHDTCLCMPSWTGHRCGKTIAKFCPLSGHLWGARYLEDAVGWFTPGAVLDVVVWNYRTILQLLSHLTILDLLIFLPPLLHLLQLLRLVPTYRLSRRHAQSLPHLLLSQLSFDNPLHLVNYLWATYVYGRVVYSLVGEAGLLCLVALSLVLTPAFSLLLARLTLSPYSTLPSSALPVAIATFATLALAGIPPSLFERAAWTVGVPVLGHLFWDTVALGGALDWGGYAGGWVAGVVGYAWWGRQAV